MADSGRQSGEQIFMGASRKMPMMYPVERQSAFYES